MSDFKHVPIKATDEMMVAASNCGYPLTWSNIVRVWKAMIATAPTQPSPAESDKEAVRNAALEETLAVCWSKTSVNDTQLNVAIAGIESLKSQPAQPSDCQEMSDDMRSFIEGMSVSIDVSTGQHDSGNRLFGTVSEVMDSGGDKHGVILLVHDQKPNFKPSDTEKDAVKRVTAYLVRKDKDRHYDQSVIHTYDGNIELRTDDLKSLIKAAMKAQERP